jgi:glutathione synthase/RimK-type ligase-like ATP-grasp enzyme
MKHRIGFYKKPQGVFTEEFISEIEKDLSSMDGVELHTDLDYKKAYVINGDVYVGDFNMSELDVYFWHDTIGAKIWRGDNHHLNVLKALEKKCAVVNSAESTRIVNDKYYSHLLLKQGGLPVVDFSLVNLFDQDSIKKCYRTLGKEVLLKPRFRGFGMGIVKVDSEEHLIEVIEFLQSYLPHGKGQILMEKFYPNDVSKWISVVVMGEKVLFGYRKKLLGDSDWKIYDPERKDARGQKTDYVDPPEELQKISLEAKRIIGKDIICFDFISTEDGYKIVDENGRPGLYAHCLKKGNIDLKKEIIDLIMSKVKK